MYWTTCVIVTVCAFGLEDTTFDAALFYSTLINTAYRSATISNKYGTYPQQEVDRIFETSIDQKQVRDEMSLDSWTKQETKTIELEIKSIGWREGITTLSPRYDGLVKSAAIYLRKNPLGMLLMIIGLTIALFRALLFAILNTFVGLNFFGETTHERILFGWVVLWQFMYFAVIPSFFLLAVRDFKRANNLADLNTRILQGQPAPEIENVVVLMNTIEDRSQAVLLVRKLDRYGDRIIHRNQAFTGFTIIHSILLSIVLIPGYFELNTYNDRKFTE